MKRKTKMAWATILIVILILIGVGIFLIQPDKEVQYFDKSKAGTGQVNYLESKNLDLKNLTLSVTIDENKLNTIIATNSDVEDFKAQLEDNKIVFYKKVSILGSLNSQYKMVFNLSRENDNLVLTLDSAYLGKIKIANSTVMKELKKNESANMTVDETQNKIIIKLQDVKLSDAKIEDNLIKIKVDLRPYLKNGLDSIINMFK